MQAFVGTIMTFGFNFAPSQWALCNGQIIAITQNQALFALLGTVYGGNGVSNFQLPNLQSRSPIGFGQGLGLSTYVLGQAAGSEQVTLGISNMPIHTHTATFTPTGGSALSVAVGAATTPGTTAVPVAGSVLAANHSGQSGINMWAPSGTATSVSLGGVTFSGGGGGGTVANATTGQSIPTPLMNPYLAVNFSIALFGIFPSRN